MNLKVTLPRRQDITQKSCPSPRELETTVAFCSASARKTISGFGPSLNPHCAVIPSRILDCMKKRRTRTHGRPMRKPAMYTAGRQSSFGPYAVAFPRGDYGGNCILTSARTASAVGCYCGENDSDHVVAALHGGVVPNMRFRVTK